MASKAQLQMLMNMNVGKQGQQPPNKKKKKGGSLANAAKRKLAMLQAQKQKQPGGNLPQGNKNGNN